MIKSPCPCKPILQEIFRNLFEIPRALVGRVILSMNRPFVLLLVLVIDSSSWLRGRGRGRARERLGSWSQCATEKSWRLSMNRPLTPSPNGREGGRRSGEGMNPASFSNAYSRGPGAELRSVD